MKRKVVAFGLTAVLCLSMSFTAFAASSTTTSNSSTTEESSSSGSSTTSSATVSSVVPVEAAATTVEKALPGRAVAPETVQVAITDAAGQVVAVSLDAVVDAATEVIAASAVTPENAVADRKSVV